MNTVLTLKGFTQEVSLKNPNDIQYFLVFSRETGADVRLPVLKETTETLIAIVYGNDKPSIPDPVETPEIVEEEYEAPSEQLEDDSDPAYFGDEQDDSYEEDSEVEDDGQGPQTEDEVPEL